MLFNTIARQKDCNPNLVIIDSLRKVYAGEERDGEMPSQVYGKFREIFPEASIMFLAHDRKHVRQPDGRPAPSREEFSGHNAWANDAQSTMRVERVGQRIHLEHNKSQFSETLDEPLKLQLAQDGITIIEPDTERVGQARKIMGENPGLSASALDNLIAEKLKTSTRNARRVRALAKQGAH